MQQALAMEALRSLGWGSVPPINQNLAKLDSEELGWIDSIGPGDVDFARRQQRIGVPLLAAMTHPWATFDNLNLSYQWLSWLFALDDQLDDGQRGRDPQCVADFKCSLMPILSGHEHQANAVPMDPLLAGLQRILQRLQIVASPAWYQRFVDHVVLYLDACQWESANRQARRCPSVEEYLGRRQSTGAVHPCFDMLMPTLGICYSQQAWADPMIKTLEYVACEIITLSNDLISFTKEQAVGDFHNLLSLLVNHGETEARALAEVADRISSNLKAFDEVSQRLMLDQQLDPNMSRYVYGLKNWTVGNFYWSMQCRRF